MKKKALQVIFDVEEPSVLELTVGERVQVDRLKPAHGGYVAERCGDLVGPGVTTLALGRGSYFFKTLSEARLKVVRGGVSTRATTDDKDPWPDPPRTPKPSPSASGDEVGGDAPRFTVE